MKKKIFSAALAVCLLCVLSVSALAAGDFQVTYTADGDMKTNFTTGDIADVVSVLQPGDEAVMTVTLTNANDDAANWYMKNEVLSSLEDGTSASGGAYTYRLEFSGPSGSAVLYDSDTVGGDGSVGLHSAVGALQDYFYLDNLTKGQTGTVTLTVALDGETQGTSYVNTVADLSMQFAVEPSDTPAEPGSAPASSSTSAPGESPAPTASPRPSSSVGQVVKTGDEMNLFPFYVAMAVSGLLFLVLAIDSVRRRKREREENT